MKEYYYYIRSEHHAPIVTVCLVKTDTEVCRGIAICSNKDNPVKKIGRKLAKKRAMKAYHSKKDSHPIHGKSELNALLRLETNLYLIVTQQMKNKSTFDPMLCSFENAIVTEPEREQPGIELINPLDKW